MQSKIKKIIAREGLVIIGIIFLAIGFFLIYQQVPPTYIYKIEANGQSYQVKRNDYLSESELLEVAKEMLRRVSSNPNPHQGLMDAFDKMRHKLNLKEIAPDKLSEILTVTYIGQSPNKGYLLYTSFFLFLFAYPIYLMIRFILWAIKTLSAKQAS